MIWEPKFRGALQIDSTLAELTLSRIVNMPILSTVRSQAMVPLFSAEVTQIKTANSPSFAWPLSILL